MELANGGSVGEVTKEGSLGGGDWKKNVNVGEGRREGNVWQMAEGRGIAGGEFQAQLQNS